MKKRMTPARRFRLWLAPKRSLLRSCAALNRHCSLSLAQMRAQGLNPKQDQKGQA